MLARVLGIRLICQTVCGRFEALFQMGQIAFLILPNLNNRFSVSNGVMRVVGCWQFTNNSVAKVSTEGAFGAIINVNARSTHGIVLRMLRNLLFVESSLHESLF